MGVVKKVLRYSVGMAVAGIAGYELAKMSRRSRSGEESMRSMERRERMEYSPGREESSDPRDYRSIYHL